MKTSFRIMFALLVVLSISSCVGKKKFLQVDTDRQRCEDDLSVCIREKLTAEAEIQSLKDRMTGKDDQMKDLREQLADLRSQRDAQLTQVEGLTVLSQSANNNMERTLSQLAEKDQYIRLIQAAKTKTDSLNLALSINLKSVLRTGIEDNDVEIKIDKTVVMINLSDKMLFTSGSTTITSQANDVLAKIAEIVQSRPGFDVMVEGYTDNVPISKACIKDNWDLSVQRAANVVKALQTQHGIDPNRLIAAGRGEFNALVTNDTAENRATNRRTRIIIMPQLDQFYDLLDPDKVPAAK
jgi:chemotaxis protein MotB